MDRHISQITTAWTVFFQAHDKSSPDEEVRQARRLLLERYGRAVYRYLCAAVKDADAANELYQEFALRLVRGDFSRAHPDRGRFRAYLKTALHHLVVNYQTRRRPLQPLPDDLAAPSGDSAPLPESEKEFQEAWRTELLERTWEALALWERTSAQPYHTVLRLRLDQPDLPSQQMAPQLSTQLGRGVTAGWVRKQLHLARDKFTELLLAELRQTLDNPSPDDLEQELNDLGLLTFCHRALHRTEHLS